MRISDWSSDVCSSDLETEIASGGGNGVGRRKVKRKRRGLYRVLPGQVGAARAVAPRRWCRNWRCGRAQLRIRYVEWPRFEIGIVHALKRYAAGNIKIPDRNRFEIEFSAPNMSLAGVERRRAAHDDLGYLQVGVIIVKRADVDPESSAEPFCLGASFGSEIGEHTSELQSLMRISYAVFCLKKK